MSRSILETASLIRPITTYSRLRIGMVIPRWRLSMLSQDFEKWQNGVNIPAIQSTAIEHFY